MYACTQFGSVLAKVFSTMYVLLHKQMCFSYSKRSSVPCVPQCFSYIWSQVVSVSLFDTSCNIHSIILFFHFPFLFYNCDTKTNIQVSPKDSYASKVKAHSGKTCTSSTHAAIVTTYKETFLHKRTVK